MKKEEYTKSVIHALENGSVTQQQYEALELFISHSLHATVRAKKVILWFLRQSQYLKRTIAMTLPFTEINSPEHIFSREVADAVHDMSSSYHRPCLYDLFSMMGNRNQLRFNGGIAEKIINEDKVCFESASKNQQPGGASYTGYTIWLGYGSKFVASELIEFEPAKAEKEKLRKNYFHLSSSSPASRSIDAEFYEDKEIPAELSAVVDDYWDR